MGKGEKKVKKPLHEYPPVSAGGALLTHLGQDSLLRNGIHCIAENLLLTAAGNLVLFVNYQTGAVESFAGPPGGGIGALCIHPTRKYFAVCEKAPVNPRVVVYEYPSRRQAYVMTGGAVQGFTACTFNSEGNYLATVAMDPDFTLTIWNWKEQKTVLRNKAFGSDIYTITFNPFNSGNLVSCGLGHIKFWSMAETFTGLKLQGHVGKFGRLEISDVTGVCSFADGKVVSGSESGSLLLWEGNLVKCELVREVQNGETADYNGFRRCHDNGNVEVVQLIEKGRIVMSGGSDGYVRYWSSSQIDGAETNGTDMYSAIRCLKEVFVGEGVRIKCMSPSSTGDNWVILDAAGSIRKIPYWSYDTIVADVAPLVKPTVPLLSFHSGGILVSRASPTDNTVVTGGEDGTVRLYDYLTKKEYYRATFNSDVVQLEFFPLSADPSGTLLLAGFKDGSVRMLRKTKSQFTVLDAWRPHSSSLVAFALDKDAKQLYTTAADGTAFYFLVQGTVMKPIGYCRLPNNATATSLEWNGSGSGCFFGFTNGNILSLAPPVVDSIDHEVGYEFEAVYSGVGYRQKQKPPEKTRKVLPNGEIEESSSDDEDLDEVDNGPWAVNFIRRLPDDTMLVGMNKEELAYQYNLSIQYPNQLGPPPIPATGIDPPGRVEEPIKNLCFRDAVPLNAYVSSTGTHITIVCEHSAVLIRPWASVLDVSHAAQLHDGIDGKVTSATVSFDGKLLITTGLDGLIVTQVLGSATAVAQDLVNANVAAYGDFPNDRVIGNAPIEHSIQKQKEEDDRHRAEEAALGKKQQLLRKIHLVHKEYHSILERNAAAVGGQKLDDKEIQLDPQLLADLHVELEERVEAARLDYAWTSAKKETLLRKLRAAFVDNLQFDRFVVQSFEGKLSVASFRTPHFTEEQKESMKHLNELLSAHETQASEGGHDADSASGRASPSEQSPAGSFAAGGSPTSHRLQSPTTNNTLSLVAAESVDANTTHMSIGGKSSKAGDALNTTSKSAAKSQLEKAEERKLERIERKRGFQELQSRKPRGTDDDARSNAEIGETEKNMGDYVLKTSPNYVIPDHMRPTAERKSRQLVLLEHSINRLRMEFNLRLIGLRDLKRRLCDDVNADRARVREIAAKLKIDGVDAPTVSLEPLEEPEKRFSIDREGLENFEKEQEKERRKQEAMARAKKGFGADLASMEDEKDDDKDADKATTKDDETSAGKRQSTRESLRKPSHAPTGPISTKEKLEMDMRFKMENLRLSELEEEEQSMERELLLFEKARLERRIANTIASFDEKLSEFYQERVKLEADLCMADMRVLLLFREFQLLQEFKKKDLDLEKKLDDRKKEQRDIAEKSRACVEKVNARNQQSESLRKRMIEVAQNAEHFIAEKFPADAQTYITKVYRRKIKRRRANENDEDDDDDLTSEDDEDEQQEDDGDDGVEEEVCPANCDVNAWNEMLQLRERRLDCDDESGDILKVIYQLKKESDDLKRREDQVRNALASCEKEITAFQAEKQNQLNLLETIVVLKLSQIQCLTSNRKVPRSFADPNIVVFTQSSMDKLRQRIHELAELKAQDRKEGNHLSQDKQKLLRRRAKRQAEHNEWESKVNEVQLLKFGQRINLENLENVAVDRETEELKEHLRLEELKWERELSKFDEKLDALRQDSQQRIIENTALLKDLGSLRGQQHDLEHALAESTQKVVAKMSGGSKVATAADRANLKDLVVAQQHELDALKAEITMLRRKGGHVYTPVVQQGQSYK